MSDWFAALWEGITSLPDLIWEKGKEVLKSLFVPDTEYIQEEFGAFVEELKMKFGFDTDFLGDLFTGAEAVEDVYVDYNIPNVGGFNLKVFDSTYLIKGVEYFRYIIRGVIALWIVLYHIRQLISFFGYDAGMIAGRSDVMQQNLAGQWKSINEAKKAKKGGG